jgi:hypothetical protein
MNTPQTLHVLPALLALIGCTSPGPLKPPTWLPGSYAGTLSSPGASGCGLGSVFEPFTWTITVDGDDFRLVSKSPYGNTFTFTSKLRSEGEHWALSGSYESTTKFLGNGTFVARLYAIDHGVIFAHAIQSISNPPCQSTVTALAGTKNREP